MDVKKEVAIVSQDAAKRKKIKIPHSLAGTFNNSTYPLHLPLNESQFSSHGLDQKKKISVRGRGLSLTITSSKTFVMHDLSLSFIYKTSKLFLNIILSSAIKLSSYYF